MSGIFESLNALIKMADDPNMATAATSIGKAAQELPADIKEIRNILGDMLGELRNMDRVLDRLIPKHPYKEEPDLYGAHTDAG